MGFDQRQFVSDRLETSLPWGEEKPRLNGSDLSFFDCSGECADGTGTLKSTEPPRFDFVKKVCEEVKKIVPNFSSGLDEFLLGCLETWLHVFCMYQFRFASTSISDYARCVSKTLEDARSVSKACGSSLAYFKYKNAAFFSAWNEQILPACPKGLINDNPKYLFGGAFYRYTKCILRKGAMPSFALSILMSKKGMPRPGKDEIKKAELKSEMTMTTPKPVAAWTDPFTRVWGQVDVVHELKRTTRELFGQAKKFSLAEFSGVTLPSSSANYINGRSKAGSYGSLEDQPEFYRFLAEMTESQDWPTLTYKMVKLKGRITEFYGEKGLLDQGLQDVANSIDEVLGAELKCETFVQAYRRFFWRCFAFARDSEEPLVKVVGLAEALKVRVISKGPPVASFVLKTLQRYMWRVLKNHPLFKLIGTPITENLMNIRFGLFLQEHFRMHSGDYSAATDELHSYVSEAIADELCLIFDEQLAGFGSGLKPLLLKLLTRHIYDTTMGRLPQQRGQLMGSIVSFPFLCIANATLIRMTTEQSSFFRFGRIRRVSLRDLQSWINGDDCLTRYHRDEPFPLYWRGLGSVFGFSESVGKTYDSEDLCSINSNFFLLREGRWRQIPYINLGLIEGFKRSSVGSGGESDPMELAARHKTLLDECPEHLRHTIHDYFMYKNMELIKTFRGSWFLPQWAGGLGLIDVHDTLTVRDLQHVTIATKIISEGKPLKLDPVPKAWRLYDDFNKFIRTEYPLIVPYPYLAVETMQETVAIYGDDGVIERLHDANGMGLKVITWCSFLKGGLSSVYSPVEESARRSYRSLSAFNRKVTLRLAKEFKEGNYVKPFPKEWLAAETKPSVLPLVYSKGNIRQR